MIGGATAFAQFKQLARELQELGYEVRETEEFGEFAMNGYICSYRYFGVLDIDFLRPGEQLLSRQEPDLVFDWDGKGWREVTNDGLSEVRRETPELFKICLKRLNYELAGSLGFFPNVCVLLSHRSA